MAQTLGRVNKIFYYSVSFKSKHVCPPKYLPDILPRGEWKKRNHDFNTVITFKIGVPFFLHQMFLSQIRRLVIKYAITV